MSRTKGMRSGRTSSPPIEQRKNSMSIGERDLNQSTFLSKGMSNYNANSSRILDEESQNKALKSGVVPDKTIISVHKVLSKGKEFVLKIYPSEKEITRKLNDIYWLQNSLMVEFPFYYVC